MSAQSDNHQAPPKQTTLKLASTGAALKATSELRQITTQKSTDGSTTISTVGHDHEDEKASHSLHKHEKDRQHPTFRLRDRTKVNGGHKKKSYKEDAGDNEEEDGGSEYSEHEDEDGGSDGDELDEA